MVIEMRTYRLKPGKRPEFLESVLMPMIDRYDVVVVDGPPEIVLR